MVPPLPRGDSSVVPGGRGFAGGGRSAALVEPPGERTDLILRLFLSLQQPDQLGGAGIARGNLAAPARGKIPRGRAEIKTAAPEAGSEAPAPGATPTPLLAPAPGDVSAGPNTAQAQVLALTPNSTRTQGPRHCQRCCRRWQYPCS